MNGTSKEQACHLAPAMTDVDLFWDVAVRLSGGWTSEELELLVPALSALREQMIAVQAARPPVAPVEPVHELSPRLRELMIKFDEHCVYCDSQVSINANNRRQRPTIDHVIATANGGSNHSDNLVLACASCNSSKGTRDVDEWMAMKGYWQ